MSRFTSCISLVFNYVNQNSFDFEMCAHFGFIFPLKAMARVRNSLQILKVTIVLMNFRPSGKLN